MDQTTKKAVEFASFIAMLRTAKKASKLISVDTAIKITGCEPDHLYFAVRRSMEEDKAQNRPFIASFLVGKNNQPIPQYFQYAKDLDIDVQNPKGYWQGQLAKLGVPNVSNIIRGLNANGGSNRHPHHNGHQHRDSDETFSSETRSFYGETLSSSPTDTNHDDRNTDRTRGRRGGRGRSRSTVSQPVI